MPIYEYRCTKCEAQFETLVRNAQDEREVVCTRCGSPEVARLLSVFSGKAGDDAPLRATAAPSCAPRGGFS